MSFRSKAKPKKFRYFLDYTPSKSLPPGCKPIPREWVQRWCQDYKQYRRFRGLEGYKVWFEFDSEQEREHFAELVKQGYKERGYVIEPVFSN